MACIFQVAYKCNTKSNGYQYICFRKQLVLPFSLTSMLMYFKRSTVAHQKTRRSSPNRKKIRPSKLVVGVRQENYNFKSIRIDPVTDKEDMNKYLKDAFSNIEFICESLEAKYPTCKSFNLGYPISFRKSMFEPALLAKRAIVAKLFPPKPTAVPNHLRPHPNN